MDKKALLNELKIDRSENQVDTTQPIKWFLAIAVLGGLGFVGWSVQFPSQPVQALEVRTILAQAPAEVNSDNSVLDATGYVIARRMATVSSKVTGKVIDVLIEEGMVVEEGQVLARLDDSINRAQLALAESQVTAANAAIAELEVQIRQAELNLTRTRDLAERNLASQADLDADRLSVEALSARLIKFRRDIDVAERTTAIQRQFLEDMQIRAPFAGVVIAKAAQPGEMISPIAAGGGFTATGICTIVDMGSLEVEVDVNEAYINRVYARQPATISLNAYPDDPFRAEVIAIIPAANRNQATVRVRIGFIERDERVLPEMGVRVSFMEEGVTNEPAVEVQIGVLIPESAVANLDGQLYVWVVQGEQVSRRNIEVSDKIGGRVLIIAGLRSGERVVTGLNEELLLSLEEGLAVSVLN
ncbi:MAG: efflux RND transporter periplasmic adaptor subunit [Gammaproteobacteria bacterium]|nr:efflux RND transporter periplasmic adaptor subunit [Gammaproteobacteria bacterium]